MKATNKRIKLDWNKLVGFKQAKPSQNKTMVGGKVTVGVKAV